MKEAKQKKSKKPNHDRAKSPKILKSRKPTLTQYPKSLYLPLEVPGDSCAHPDPPFVTQVQFVTVWLSLAPAVHEMAFDLLELAIFVSPGAVLNPKPVKPGGNFLLLLVEVNNPAIELLNLVQEILVVWGRRSIVFKPDKLWRVEDSGDQKLIVGVRMVVVLAIHHCPELEDTGNNSSSGLASGQVIKASTQEDPHGSGGLSIVQLPGILEI